MHFLFRSIALAALLLGCLHETARSESLGGFPDLSLNGFGFDIGPFREEHERITSSAENGEGLMLALGTYGMTDTRCITSRYRDSRFNGVPLLVLDAVTNESCSKILALGSGEFRVIGSGVDANGRNTGFIAALNTDGRLDTTFHQQGTLLINDAIPWLAATERTVLTSGMIDAQGRLLALGRVIDTATSTTRGLLMRFLPDGSLDAGFGVGGSLPLADFNPPIVIPSSVAIDSSARVYVGGHTANAGVPDVAVIFRLLDEGQVDLDFGAGMDAVARTGGGGRGFFNNCSRVRDLVLDATDRMVMGCEPDVSGMIPGPILPPGVLRLDTDGQPDVTFGGGDGYVELLPWNSPLGAIGSPRIALRSNGQIVAGATLYRASTDIDPQDIFVTRLFADGSTDGSFGFSGVHQSNTTIDLWQTTDFRNEQLHELRLDARERVVLSGAYANHGNSSNPTYGLLSRLGMADPLANAGFLDPDFNYLGYRIERIGDVGGPRRSTFGSDVTIDAQNRPVMLGNLTLGTTPVSTVCGISRYLPGGAHDSSFAENGQRAISLVPGGTTVCDSVLALSSGELLVAGYHLLPSSHTTGTVVRLLDDGTLDTQFWGDGVLDTWSDLGFSTRNVSAMFNDMIVDRQGRILLLGWGRAIGAQDNDFRCGFGALDDLCGIVIRLLPDGSLDTGFGNAGMRLLISSTNPSRMVPTAMALDLGERIIVVGDEGSAPGDYSAILYDIADDGMSSVYRSLRGTTSCLAATTVGIDAANARVLDCGRQSDMSLLRLLPNNSIDLNFGLGGLATVDFYTNAGGDFASVASIIPQPDRSLIVVGTQRHPAVWESSFGRYDIGVLKLDSVGANRGYGAGYGDLFRLPTFPGAFDENAIAAVMQDDGRIVVAGSRIDQRVGTPPTDSSEMLILRLGNPLPEPQGDAVFRDGFE